MISPFSDNTSVRTYNNAEEKMSVDITRAWKDPEYRRTLTPEELASVPPNPAGEVSDEELSTMAGGASGTLPNKETSLLWCPSPTQPATNCCEVSKDICCVSR